MGIIFDTSTTEGKLQIALLFLLSPFIILWNFLKWIAERLGIYKPPVYGDVNTETTEVPAPIKQETPTE